MRRKREQLVLSSEFWVNVSEFDHISEVKKTDAGQGLDVFGWIYNQDFSSGNDIIIDKKKKKQVMKTIYRQT